MGGCAHVVTSWRLGYRAYLYSRCSKFHEFHEFHGFQTSRKTSGKSWRGCLEIAFARCRRPARGARPPYGAATEGGGTTTTLIFRPDLSHGPMSTCHLDRPPRKSMKLLSGR